MVLLAAVLLAPTLSRAQESVREDQKYRVDLDGDGVPDDLVLSRGQKDPDCDRYCTVDITLSRSGHYSFEGRWDTTRSQEMSRGNLVRSHSLYIARFPHAGTLIFLFGVAGDGVLPSLDIYRIGAQGVERYLHRDEWAFTKPLAPSDSSLTTIRGVATLMEFDGSNYPKAERDTTTPSTYQPVIVIRLAEHAVVDTAASIRLTRAATGGYAGLEYREDLRTLRRKDGTLILWDEKLRKRIP
jgi:hypothetical protein